MGKGVLTILAAIIATLMVAGCAGLKRPTRNRSLETRALAPADQARIQAIAAESEAAAAEMHARMARQKASP